MSEFALRLIGTVLVIAPFPLLAWMAVSLGQQRERKTGIRFFLAMGVVLAAVYFGGLNAASAKAAQHHPGQATMAAGATVVYSYGILIVALVVRCRLGLKKASPHDPRP